ncbi:MAG: PemK family transcriptional regulator [Gammaproteobacteria bacterium RIFCSPHIGHO2_12_FULL_42_13]|nr:MAG: PemK family transcriptional regulator [Gammaproteobacteria bacterium RIFCSPHIGHO2_12_FULL_42_13]
MPYIPEKGDVIWLDFDPSSGKEIIKRRPAFVISSSLFNSRVKMVVVAPITSKIHGIPLEVVLPRALKTRGSILVYQLKSLDFINRKAKFIEKAPSSVIEQVTALAAFIIQ